MQRFGVIAAIAGTMLFVLVVMLAGGDDRATQPESAAQGGDAEQASGERGGDRAAANDAVAAKPRRKVSGPHDDPVPILMYHVTKSAPAGTPYPDLWVSPADFKGQMQWLDDNGYTGVTMEQLFDYWDQGWELPDKPVVISFDDGYPSHDRVARKVLAGYGWPGVLFLELNNVGSPKTGFTKGMVKRLIDAGWEIGSHTVSHPDLTKVGADELRFELVESRKRIKSEYGQDADFFCYPAGRYDDTVVAAVERAGYRGATTTVDGVAGPGAPFELKRIRIDGGDGVDGFAAKVG
jgi:peptidoglycan/xylan/chitin deacetylase (PgdA/CDA1 family)